MAKQWYVPHWLSQSYDLNPTGNGVSLLKDQTEDKKPPKRARSEDNTGSHRKRHQLSADVCGLDTCDSQKIVPKVNYDDFP